jgi:hypothetical protein
VINGNVFITSRVPPYTVVSMEPPKLTYRPRRGKPSDDSAGGEASVG